MLLLASTSDIIRVVTSAAASVTSHASWLDNASGTVTPGRTNTAAIATATTTTVVGSPASSTYRNVAYLALTNTHASAATRVTVQHYDGSNSEDLISVQLLAGESLILDREGVWRHYDNNGGEYQAGPSPVAGLGQSGVIAESIPRELCTETSTAGPASGTLFMQAIYLRAGTLVSNILMWSGSSGANTPTHWLMGLYDSSLNLLATSADQTSTAWIANTAKSLPMTAPYRVPTSGVYYIGFFMTATAVTTLKGQTAITGGQLHAATPTLHGTSSTGLTTALPNPAASITGGTTGCLYAAVT